MIVSINQPAYLPWLGYFHRIAISDLHIVLDHVQFEKNSYTNRNKIRTKESWCWLTMPVKTKGRFGDLAINSIEAANDLRWNEKHLNSMRTNYSRAPYYAAHEPFFQSLYTTPPLTLFEVIKQITSYLLREFFISTPIVFSSEMGIGAKKDELVLELCKAVKANRYLSGPLGRNYLREDIFRNSGIEVLYQDYQHPVYKQAFPGFFPNMAAVDLLFNYGPDSRNFLLSGNATKESFTEQQGLP